MLLLALGLSAGAVFFNPASQSLLPVVVDEEELIAGNSGLWTAAVVSQIALAPLAGGMVAILGVTPAFLVNAATYYVCEEADGTCLYRRQDVVIPEATTDTSRGLSDASIRT